MAVDSLLTAHVGAYEVIHSSQADAIVTTNNSCVSIYECDRLLTDLLLCRSFGIERSGGRRLDRRAPVRVTSHCFRREPRESDWPGGSAPGARCTGGRPAIRAPSRGGSSTPSTTAPTSARWTPSASTSTSPRRATTSGCPATARPEGATVCPPGPCGTTRPDPDALRRWLGIQHCADAGPALVGGRERHVQPGAKQPLLCPVRRLEPAAVPAVQCRRRHGRHRPGRARDRLLALVAGRQLRVGFLRAPLRDLRRSTATAAATGPNGWTPMPLARILPAPTGPSSPDCGEATGRCWTRPDPLPDRLLGDSATRRPSDSATQPASAPTSPANTASACSTIWMTSVPAGTRSSMAPTPCPEG